MFRSCLSSLVLAIVILFMLMSLPIALSEARTSSASAGPAPEGDKGHATPVPVLTPAVEEALVVLTPTAEVASSQSTLPPGRRLRAREAFLLGAVVMSALALLMRGTG